MIGPGQLQLIVSVLFVSLLGRPVVDVTWRLMQSVRGWAWLGMVVWGALTLWHTGRALRGSSRA